MNAILYSRQNKKWSNYLGKRGRVIVSSQIKVSSSKLAINLPYCLLLVAFGKEKKELMGAAGEIFKTGDRVECVLRKLDQATRSDIISYGLKATKLR